MNSAAPVWVMGVDCISAAGLTLAENLASLDAGRRSLAPPVLFPAERQIPVFMCALPEPRQGADLGTGPFAALGTDLAAHSLSRTVRLAIHATQEALQTAGLSLTDLAGLRVGVCLGTSVGTALEFYE